MKYAPGDLTKRFILAQPTNDKTTTGNTKGIYSPYATRYGCMATSAGQDTVQNDQNVATNTRTFVIRYDANVKPSWALQYDGDNYYITAVDDPDNGVKRYMELTGTKRESITLVS